MATNYIFFTIIIIGNLFILNFAQVRNNSDVSVVQIEKVTHSHNNNITYEEINKIGFENKSNNYNAYCDCGPGSRRCWFLNNNEVLCDCKDKYAQKGDRCEECDCGYAHKKCSYDASGNKKCECDSYFKQNGDKCERCTCGALGECSFKNYKKICDCPNNFKENKYGECEYCDCGFGANGCDFDSSGKVCTCKSGYILKNGKCVACDCGYAATSCDLTSDNKYTRCKCKPGYVAERTTWEVNEKCELPGISGWKIATYIEGVFFGLIIIACICSICSKKMSE